MSKLKPVRKGEDPNDINTELATDEKLNEEFEKTKKLEKEQAHEEVNKKLYGRKGGYMGQHYEGDKKHAERASEIESRARRGYKEHR
jgi:hypothetical protein